MKDEIKTVWHKGKITRPKAKLHSGLLTISKYGWLLFNWERERESDINKKNLMRLIKELTIICFG